MKEKQHHALIVRLNCRGRTEKGSVTEDTTFPNVVGAKHSAQRAALTLRKIRKIYCFSFRVRCISTAVQCSVVLFFSACCQSKIANCSFALIHSLVCVREAIGNTKTGHFVSKNSARIENSMS